MIIAKMGLPGAGKSYTAVLDVVEALKQGRWVITNMPLKRDQFEDCERLVVLDFEELGSVTVEEIGALGVSVPAGEMPFQSGVWFEQFVQDNFLARREDDKTVGPLFVIDEAGVVFQQIRWKEANGASILSFLRRHRHYRSDVFLLVQEHGQLPLEIKRLVQWWVELVDMRSFLGFGGWIARTFKSHYGSRVPLKVRTGRFRKEVFRLYGSHDLGAGVDGGEGSEEGVTGVTRGWWRFGSIWVVLICIGVLAWQVPNAWRQTAGRYMGEPAGVEEEAVERQLSQEGGKVPEDREEAVSELVRRSGDASVVDAVVGNTVIFADGRMIESENVHIEGCNVSINWAGRIFAGRLC